MWEHYRFVELLLRKYAIASVAAWDWAVRSLSKLGEPGGNQSWSSSHGNNNSTSQSTPGGRRGKLINKACWAWAEGDVCSYGENCRFRHSCPACPGKKDHRKDTCLNSTSTKVCSTSSNSNAVVVGSGEVVWDPGEGVACPAEVEQKDKTPSSTLQRNKKHRSPQYVSGVASTSFLLVVPPRTRTSLFSGFSATSGRSSQPKDGQPNLIGHSVPPGSTVDLTFCGNTLAPPEPDLVVGIWCCEIRVWSRAYTNLFVRVVLQALF
eukprot:g69164.t1